MHPYDRQWQLRFINSDHDSGVIVPAQVGAEER